MAAGPGSFRTLQELACGLSGFGKTPALVAVRPSGNETLTFEGLAERARRICEELRRQGLGRGEPVGILAANGPAWVATCLGILMAGAAVMPLDVRQAEADRTPMIAASRCRLLYRTRDASDDRSESLAEQPTLALERIGPSPLSVDEGGAITAIPMASPQDTALLLHTSGTTGAPKAVPLTHENVLSNIRALTAERLAGPNDRALVPLPLHHVYPLVVGLFLPLSLGASVALPAGLSGPALALALKSSGANMLIGVPRLYDALLAAINERLKTLGRIPAWLASQALSVSIALANRGAPAFGRILFGPVRRRVAPALWRLASGGAALDEATERALVGLGYEVLVGYGLTETSPIVTFNLPGRSKIGSAGRPLPGSELRIAQRDADGIGEIEVRGPNVFGGYRDNPMATQAAFTADGWFRTGDRGRLDPDGYLQIRGRIGELLVLPGGEKLMPETVEERYQSDPTIGEIAVLLEDGKLVALVAPSSASPDRNVRSDEAEIRAALSERASTLPSYMQLAGFALVDGPLPRTQLGKLKRHLLPPLYRMARAGSETRAAAVAELPASDRALLENPTGRRVWNWLRQRFPIRPLSLDMSLGLDLGLDSLGLLEIAMSLEQALGIALEDEALGRVVTLRDLVTTATMARTAPGSSGKAEAQLSNPGHGADLIRLAGHWLDRWVVRLVFGLHVSGLEYLPTNAPFVLCPNHASYLDGPVLAAALPRATFERVYWGGAADLLFSTRFRRAFSRLARILPIDPIRNVRSSLELGAEVLRRGEALVWFPEGWRTSDGALQPFQPGIGALMLRTPALVVPAYISGTFEAWPPSRKFPRPGRVAVQFGPPLDAERWKAFGGQENKEKLIAAAIKAAVAAIEERARTGAEDRAATDNQDVVAGKS